MKSSQENKLSMYYAVQKICGVNNSVWKGLPAFVSAFASLETNIGKIENALGIQVKNITGVTEDKGFIEDAMIEKTLQVSSAVFAYANDINDLALKGKVDLCKTDLNRLRDSISAQRCQLVHDEANVIVGSLGNYGITAADLSNLQAKVDAFGAMLASPRTAITERKGATNEIVKLLAKTDVVLKNKMDKLMEKFKVNNPEFYRLFFNARIIVELGSRTTSLNGKIKNENDDKSVENANVELVLNEGKPNERVETAVTDKNGEFGFETIPAGEHKLKVSKGGFEPTEVDNVKVKSGKSNKVNDVGMKKVA